MILVVGDVILDEYQHFSTTPKVNPDGAHIPVIAADCVFSSYGAANLVARTIHKITPATLLCALPSSALIVMEPVRAHYIVTTPVESISKKQRIIVDGETRYRVDDDYVLQAEESVRVTKSAVNRLVLCSLVVVSDFNKGVVTEAGFKEILEQARSYGVPVLVDPKKPLSTYAGADLIKANKAEFLRFHAASEQDLDSTAQAAVKELSLKYLVITDGPNGSSLYTEDSCTKFPVPSDIHKASAHPNVVGAGDVQMAHIAAHYGTGSRAEVESAVERAVRAASCHVFRGEP